MIIKAQKYAMFELRYILLAFFLSSNFLAKGQHIEKKLRKIDSVVNEAIKKEAFPGCVIYASVGDSVFLLKSFGHHTYDSNKQVSISDIYDLASLTKVISGSLAMMKLYEDGYIDLDDRIGDYINKIGLKIGQITFREALAHQGGLYPWIPYYQESKKKNNKFKNKTVSTELDDNYSFPITDSLHLHKKYYSKIKKMIRKSKVFKNKKYRYSGLFFYLIPELVENLTDTLYQEYLQHHFYTPLGTTTLTFNPREKFELDRIIPTEIDTFFRMKLIHGKVHDEGAIMMKGISANAGLFSNIEDVATIFKMLINNGQADTLQLLSPQIITLFTSTQYPNNKNRRGLGFDKPLLQYDSIRSSVAKGANFRSFGHTGYTGTLAWADPSNELIFIFLSNRVYPSRTNLKLYKLNVRPIIHQLLYDILK